MPELFKNTSTTRSANMRAISSQGNRSTERKLRGMLVSGGYSGWRLHAKDILGTPDFFFAEAKLAVFVDGCFWHGCPQCGHVPKTNSGYWRQKIEKNYVRDQSITRKLRRRGYRVIRVWECNIRERPVQTLSRIQLGLSKGRMAQLTLRSTQKPSRGCTIQGREATLSGGFRQE
jgi:DNA mismatch endonuclease, patch repair protein